MTDARAMEEMNLKMKFCNLNYQEQSKAQKIREVSPARAKDLKTTSYGLWKRLNPGYLPDEAPTTTNKDAQDMQDSEFVVSRRDNYRKRDKHTEYVEYVVRDKALARPGGSSSKKP